MERTKRSRYVPFAVELRKELRDLIASSFDSVEALEILMLLKRSPQTYWGRPAIAEQLGIPEETVRTKLDALRTRGILTIGEQTGAYRYAPADPELATLVDELAAAYTERRANVINTLYSANLERLRAFSNAFKVK